MHVGSSLSTRNIPNSLLSFKNWLHHVVVGIFMIIVHATRLKTTQGCISPTFNKDASRERTSTRADVRYTELMYTLHHAFLTTISKTGVEAEKRPVMKL